VIETAGDRRAPNTAWGEGAFVAAIEEALLDGRIDVAVHSAKDVPIEQDARLRIAAFLPRADPRDALVVRRDSTARSLADLAPGTRLGTDSPRRTGFVRALRPDLVVHPLHGNVDTRLRRLDAGETDALLLACAGLDRLGLAARIAERLAADVVPPAPGQGAIAVQVRAGDGRVGKAVELIDDATTRIAVEAERAFLEASGGGCRAPIGALATQDGTNLLLVAGHAEPDGSRARIARRHGDASAGRVMGRDLARELLASNAAGSRSGRVRRTFGRILILRAVDQAAELATALEARALEPVVVPAIAIVTDPPGGRLDAVARHLGDVDWAIVTSANGATALAAALRRTDSTLGGPRWAAIGSRTAAALQQVGIEVSFRPSRAEGRVLASELPIERGDRVLVIKGDLADREPTKILGDRGATVDEVVAYRTVIAPASSGPHLRAALAERIELAIVTSASTVRGLRALGEAEGLDVTSIAVVCIGPETRAAATEAGFRVVAQAPSPDAPAVAATAARFLNARIREIA
jgi:hydroxymethylbilane synthase